MTGCARDEEEQRGAGEHFQVCETDRWCQRQRDPLCGRAGHRALHEVAGSSADEQTGGQPQGQRALGAMRTPNSPNGRRGDDQYRGAERKARW